MKFHIWIIALAMTALLVGGPFFNGPLLMLDTFICPDYFTVNDIMKANRDISGNLPSSRNSRDSGLLTIGKIYGPDRDGMFHETIANEKPHVSSANPAQY